MKRNRHSIQCGPGALRPPGRDTCVPLDQAAVTLLDSAPASLRLLRLREEFPHVLNRLAAGWHDPLQVLSTFQALIDGDRPHRHGFPPPILLELLSLRRHYFTVIHPELAPLLNGHGG